MSIPFQVALFSVMCIHPGPGDVQLIQGNPISLCAQCAVYNPCVPDQCS